MNRRQVALITLSACVAAAAIGPVAHAKGARRKAHVVRVDTPLGRQSGNVVLPFLLADISGKPVDVEVQYGADFNADGQITDDEYRQATEDRLDARNTRTNLAPQLFTTGAVEFETDTTQPTGDVSGASHGYVWRTTADVGTARFLHFEYALTPQGRRILDLDNPGAYLFALGPSGLPEFAGVKVRMRTVVPRKPRRKTIYGEWAYSGTFAIDNNRAPSMTIDSIDAGSPLMVHWTAYDADSEDFNGNGQLDVADGEDVNGNGVLDCGRVGVAFDFHIVGDDEDPAAMTDFQLSELSWIPCERVDGVGDTDSLDARPGVLVPTTGDLAGVCTAPPGVGRSWVFAWDPVAQIGTTFRGFIVRGTPFDEKRSVGATAYSRTIVYEAE
jgi:hypothetical protein